MGGLLADPVRSHPRLFGPNSSFGGESGVQWLVKYPYALPMLANFFFLSSCAALVGYGLEEVSRNSGTNKHGLYKTTHELQSLTHVQRHFSPAKESLVSDPPRSSFLRAVSRLCSVLPPRSTPDSLSVTMMRMVPCWAGPWIAPRAMRWKRRPHDPVVPSVHFHSAGSGRRMSCAPS